MLITSLDNDRIKGYIKLKDRKYRKKTGKFIVEGMHLVLEACKTGIVEELILEKDVVLPIDLPTVYVTNEIINKISEMECPSNVMALCNMFNNDIVGDKILMLDDLQDPRIDISEFDGDAILAFESPLDDISDPHSHPDCFADARLVAHMLI